MTKCKKIILLLLAVLLAGICFRIDVDAAVKSIKAKKWMEGELMPDSPSNSYKIHVKKDGYVKLNYKAKIVDGLVSVKFGLYKNGKALNVETFYDDPELNKEYFCYVVKKGNYEVRVFYNHYLKEVEEAIAEGEDQVKAKNAKYSVKYASYSWKEKGKKIASQDKSPVLKKNEPVSGLVFSSDDFELNAFYKISVKEITKVKFALKTRGRLRLVIGDEKHLLLYNDKTGTMHYKDGAFTLWSNDHGDDKNTIVLKKGTYYFVVMGDNGAYEIELLNMKSK